MRTTLLVLAICASAATLSAHGNDQRLGLQVSPAAAVAPAILTVRTTVEPSPDNRSLTIVVESDSYRRSSEIPLDGEKAPRLNVVNLNGLPGGLYEVTAILMGPSGPRASTLKLVKVAPGLGNR